MPEDSKAENDPNIIAAGNNGLQRSHRPRLAWRKILLLSLLPAVIIGLLGLGIAFLIPRWYTAVTTLYFTSLGNSQSTSAIAQLVKGGTGSPSEGGNVPIVGGVVSSPLIANSPTTAIAILQSDRCRRQVAAVCDLSRHWHKPTYKVTQILLKNVNADVDKSGLVAISANAETPQLAAKIAQAYIDTLKQIATTLSTSVSHENRQFVDKELASAKRDLEIKRAKLATAQESLIRSQTPGGVGPRMTDTLLDLSARKKQALADLKATDARIQQQTISSQLSLKQGTGLPATTPYSQAQVVQLRQLETQFAQVQQTLGVENPEYQRVKLQRDTARAQVQAEIKREQTALQSGIAPSVANLYTLRAGQQVLLDSLTRDLTSFQRLVNRMPQADRIQLRNQNEVTLGEQQVALLTSEDEKAKLAEARDTPTFVVVDPPLPPDEATGPRRAAITAFSALGGFLLGVLWQMIPLLKPQDEADSGFLQYN